MATSYITFTVHFILPLNSLFSDILTFHLDIIYNTFLRRLEDDNVIAIKVKVIPKRLIIIVEFKQILQILNKIS